jgi:signal peptidase I
MDRIRVTVTKDVSRGDIVVFKTPQLAAARCGASGKFVKRVSGLPGETWAERNGFVYIDGKRLSEPYLAKDRRGTDTHAPVKLGHDRFFVLGDNRQFSCDSRVWGPVPRRNVVGKVTEILRGSKTIHVR